jgi:O-6-methylguanine DNA methyltransferase
MIYPMTETFIFKCYDSPLGAYTLVSSQRGVVCISSERETDAQIVKWERNGVLIQQGNSYNDIAAAEMDAYFAGNLRQFTVKLDLRGTPFQCDVWQALCHIPYGETRSYQQVALDVDRPNSARPTGQAIGHNPIGIIVPCHRVIGSDGSLTGYGGGLDKKISLLKLEGRRLQENSIPSRIKVLPPL